MMPARLFWCNLPERKRGRGTRAAVSLTTAGDAPSVNLKLSDIARILLTDLDGRLADLLEIAACIYAADGTVARKGWEPDGSERWVRHFVLKVGVRDPAFWSETAVIRLLEGALQAMSGDRWEFHFEPLVSAPPVQDYLDFGPGATPDWPFRAPGRVLMFSGGLDSLAGAVEEAASGMPLLLVSHRSAPQIQKRQQELFQALQGRFPEVRMRRVAVWISRDSSLRNEEFTQRTRSFLFWALGLAVGASVGARGVRFFENGVVSLNLPIVDQVVGARASRTTNPWPLSMLERLGTLVVERPFAVDNPFIYKTKAEVVEVLLRHGAGSLVPKSCSCTRTMMQRKTAWHCGVCSQCIDRRFGILAAGAANLDDPADYQVDPLLGERKPGADRIMAANYVRHASELAAMSPDDVVTRFSTEVSRAARALGNVAAAAQALGELHVRHGVGVKRVLAEQAAAQAVALIDHGVPPNSLIRLALGGEHLRPCWVEMSRRICGILDRGLPTSCAAHRPANEPELQLVCDGLLKGAGEVLEREYPFLRWASTSTKPDWSDEGSLLWVELKYVRTRADVRKIEDAIAADITAYGDVGKRCLFVTYDPGHLISDDGAYTSTIHRHEGMIGHIVR